MKVVQLSTYSSGGAANGAIRLVEAIAENYPEVEIDILAASGNERPRTQVLSGWKKRFARLSFLLERLHFLPLEKDKSVRWAFSSAKFGVDISKHKLIQEADIIHIHWINQGFLSLKGIQQLFQLNKPIVWTLHDMWAFTGGCHYSGTCENFKVACGNCAFLKSPGKHDLSHQVYQQKAKNLDLEQVVYVTPSHWLKEIAESSSLLKKAKVLNRFNPINTELFQAKGEAEKSTVFDIRPDRKYLLFLSMNTTDPRKGFKHLINALKVLAEDKSHEKTEILVVGKVTPNAFDDLPFQFQFSGLLSNQKQIVEAYCSADAFVIPSLEDNLPYTVLESLSCGTPVVGFNSGGIPEMVKHQENGYLANTSDSADLAKGISWVLNHENLAGLSKNARDGVVEHFSYPVVANNFMQLYRSLLEKKN